MSSITKPDIVVQAWGQATRPSTVELDSTNGWQCFAVGDIAGLRNWMRSYLTGPVEYCWTGNMSHDDQFMSIFINDEKDAAFFALTFL